MKGKSLNKHPKQGEIKNESKTEIAEVMTDLENFKDMERS